MTFRQMVRKLDADQLYQMEKSALDEIIGNYVVEQAAKGAGMTPDRYVAHELSAIAKVSESDARAYYKLNKVQLQFATGGESFEQIKEPLMATLQSRHDQELREQLITRLKRQESINIMLAEPRYHVVSAGHPSIGGKDAPVTIVEFGDFQCPFCRAVIYSIKLLRAKYGDKIRVVYMDFPLGMHPHAMDAARAARCADRQGKFWQFHDAMFADQLKLAPADLKATARKLGLNSTQFDGCFDSGKLDADIHRDISQGRSLGVTGTPTFFVDGRKLVGALPPTRFYALIDEDIARPTGSMKGTEAKGN